MSEIKVSKNIDKIKEEKKTPIKNNNSSSSSSSSSIGGKPVVSDSDDDLPIAQLLQKRNASKLEKVKEDEKENDKKVKREKKDLTPIPTQAPVNKATTTASGEFYETTTKGCLLQSFLVRWWYAIVWPKPEEIGEPEAGYEPLDGFEGVFVSTRTDSLGKIADLRDKTNCPCMNVYKNKTSAELKELCIKVTILKINIIKILK